MILNHLGPSTTPCSNVAVLLSSASGRCHFVSMLASSCNDIARRSAITCLSCSGLGRTSHVFISTSLQAPTRIHQRKYSSSKPSSASKSEPQTPSDAPEAKVPSPESSRRSSTRLRRKARDSTREPLIGSVDGTKYNLPSVPSTQHLHPLGTPQSQRATSKY